MVRFTRALAATGSGPVAVFRFKALKAGTAPISLTEVTLGTPAGGESVTAQAPGAVVVTP